MSAIACVVSVSSVAFSVSEGESDIVFAVSFSSISDIGTISAVSDGTHIKIKTQR